MKHFFCYTMMAAMTMCAGQVQAQTDRLTDEDIIQIKTTAERQLSAYQNIMNELATPGLLNIVRISVIKDGMDLFTEHARLEVDYDTAYFPPRLAYEVEVQKYLGDFAMYHEQIGQVAYTDRILSDIQWKTPENFYYLTLAFTSVYDNLPPQRRVATLIARREAGQWVTPITYIKFKASLGSPLAFLETDTNEAAAQDSAAMQPAASPPRAESSSAAATPRQVFLNDLASGAKRGKRYLIGWRLPQSQAASVQLLRQGNVVDTLIAEQETNLFQWTINANTDPGRYQLKVIDHNNMASVTSPDFTIGRRFPMALRIGLGVTAGFYLVQTIRNDWNFGWPFDGGGPSEPPQEFPDLPEPPDLPEQNLPAVDKFFKYQPL